MENIKTIIIVYTNRKLKKAEIGKAKKYAFNSSFDLKEGDMINSPSYETNMQVVKVLDKSHKYYNASTGELSDSYSSTSQWEIRDLIIREETEEEVIYGVLLKDK